MRAWRSASLTCDIADAALLIPSPEDPEILVDDPVNCAVAIGDAAVVVNSLLLETVESASPAFKSILLDEDESTTDGIGVIVPGTVIEDSIILVG